MSLKPRGHADPGLRRGSEDQPASRGSAFLLSASTGRDLAGRPGRSRGGWRLLLEQGAPMGAPAVAVLADPIEQRALEADVIAEPLGLEPFVTKDLFPLGEELLIQRGLLDEIA